MLKGAMAVDRPAKLIATYKPDLPIRWYVQRAADDPASLRQNSTHDDEAPLVRRNQQTNAGLTTAEVNLLPEHAGSFHIVAKVGASTCYVMNLVVAEVIALPSAETPQVANLATLKNAVTNGLVAPGALVVRTGDIPFPDPQHTPIPSLQNGACAVLAGRVRVLGGGPNRRRCLDRVYAGWIQNKTYSLFRGVYTDGTAAPPTTYESKGIFVWTQAQGQQIQIAGGADFHFTDAHPAMMKINPVDAAHPLLDTGNDPVGGARTCLGKSHMTRHPTAQGEEMVAVAVDSPGTEFLVAHLSQRNALLTRGEYALTFKAYLCLWTDAYGQGIGGEDAAPGELVYGAAAEVEWGFDAAWDIVWPAATARMTRDQRQAAGSWMAGANIQADHHKDLNARITSAYTAYPELRPAQGLVEVRPVTPIRTFA